MRIEARKEETHQSVSRNGIAYFVSINSRIMSVIFVRVVISVIVALSSGSAAQQQIAASGELAGQKIHTSVDSEWARFYLEEYVEGKNADDARTRSIDDALGESGVNPSDREQLKDLSDAFSTDFATLVFVSALYSEPRNRRLQAAFHETVGSLEKSSMSEYANSGVQSYLIVFVPGYGYVRNPETGADFARQRALMADMGFKTTLIETNELGLVEENAEIIAEAIQRLSGQDKDLILVSASKGGPEVALALGRLLTESESTHVKAWISVGGFLRGSPNADRLLRWPRRAFVPVMRAISGRSRGIVRNLGTEVRGKAFDSLNLPPHLFSLQYVGAPLSGQVGDDSRRRYERLRELGPNDGLTLLADELIEGGAVITDVGLDHYFRDPLIDLKTIALTHVVIRELESRGSKI